MSASKRADVITSLHKVLAKQYTPIKPVERPVLEGLIYANCLEDSATAVADECFARLQESFFDWNEVRVTTAHELAEVLRGLRDPSRAGMQIKHTLHSVFEAVYAFDLEGLRKQNLGAAVKQLEAFRGTTPFSVSYVVQTCLGGHSIPVSETGMEIMRILGVISEKDLAKGGGVPGLERAIAKTKGPEFSSILQQFAAEFAASPFNNNLRAVLIDLEPGAKERLPKRGGRKAVPEKPAPKAAKKKSAKAETKAPPKPTKKKAAKKKAPAPAPPKAKKPPAAKPGHKSIAKKASPAAKKSASKQLARRKPR